ncbi:hypothetical protein [Autumnicola psychrophila]|uniref:Uncharacterized protein n=1 Tax=Autumnicola psychrophila TaxID=3075592 RepID=A0ABU3DQN8_9FLAO|nr:hypothetical protein [Zunongwangia sp. F225]MDT0685933.1 hypothetical protein [Zunongwangia sp. F225]
MKEVRIRRTFSQKKEHGQIDISDVRVLVNEGEFRNTKILKEETVKIMATNQLDEDVKKRMWLPIKGQVGFGIAYCRMYILSPLPVSVTRRRKTTVRNNSLQILQQIL